MRSLWQDVSDIYRSSWSFALACPLLFLIPVLFEFAQHVAEVNAGLYLSKEAARAAADDPGRMLLGYWKTLAISLPTYWMYRYIVGGRDAAYARAFSLRAVGLWLAIFIPLVAGGTWLSLFGPSLGSVLGLEGQAETAAKVALGVAQTVISIYFTAWFVAWSQGNAAVGPSVSFRIMRGHFWRTVALLLAGTLPLMALHYGSLLAIGRPELMVWIAMLIDSLVVGFLALTMAAANAVAAVHAAGCKGVELSAMPRKLGEPLRA